MDPFVKQHLHRIQAGMDLTTEQLISLARWIEEYTFLKGNRFSFVDHEYQQAIAEDKADVKYVRKCSQVGVSELAVRLAIAFCMLNRGVNLLYVLPTALFASTFSSTRLNPVLDNCPAASSSLHPGTDSASVKRFLNDSFIFMRGASRASQAISVPCDCLHIDEVDFAEDQDVLTSFTSRLTHSTYKRELWFSTPTFEGHGISYGYENSIRFVQFQKCNHCGERFLPDYYKNVKLPGFNVPLSKKPSDVRGFKERKLSEINFFNKELLSKFLVKTAYLACPKCGKAVDQSINYREFVQENPDSNSR